MENIEKKLALGEREKKASAVLNLYSDVKTNIEIHIDMKKYNGFCHSLIPYIFGDREKSILNFNF